jgi:hypothetical protein
MRKSAESSIFLPKAAYVVLKHVRCKPLSLSEIR